MSNQKYIRDAQLSVCSGVELYRRRFYLSKEALDTIDFTAKSKNMSPSEYVSYLALNAVTELPTDN